MRAAEIHVGGQYRVRWWQKAIATCTVWNTSGKIIRRSRPFPAHYLYRTVTVVEKAGRKWVVEWIEPHPLHKIPATKMIWTTRTCRDTVTGAQIINKET